MSLCQKNVVLPPQTEISGSGAKRQIHEVFHVFYCMFNDNFTFRIESSCSLSIEPS